MPSSNLIIHGVTIDETALLTFPTNRRFHHFRLRQEQVGTDEYKVKVAACDVSGNVLTDLNLRNDPAPAPINFSNWENRDVIITRDAHLEKVKVKTILWGTIVWKRFRLISLTIVPELYKHEDEIKELTHYRVAIQRRKL